MRHVAGTANKGITAKHDGTFDLKVWEDANFAGTSGQEPSESMKAVKSRCRCVITFGGVPLVWRSQLISKICLSTAHAECAGLSNSLQALTPMHDLIKDTPKQLKPTSEERPKMLCKVFEDNQAACCLSPNQQLLVRTKCFAVKCHFF